MKTVCIIGGGISGLSVAQCLKDKYIVKVLEKDTRPGGLIKCDLVEGNLYHRVGGHVFNSKRQDVLNWFWSYFDKELEFNENARNAVAYIDKPIGYPIENHIYQLEEALVRKIIKELLFIDQHEDVEVSNFEDFLKHRFGKTLYKIYFKPYNEKIWNRDLSKIPFSWLEGKMPMPTVEDILFNNIYREKDKKMVHSVFFYPKKNGSQFLADRLAENIDIECDVVINKIIRINNKWVINDKYIYDIVVFTGNIKELPAILVEQNLAAFKDEIKKLEFHGTTSVLCKVESNPYSWIYLPVDNYSSHRIICTGNFSENNNAIGIKTATIEFTDYKTEDEILENLKDIPFSPKYMKHHYTKYTYPIQNESTRKIISDLKHQLQQDGLFLVGRFAEWEYYNMDAAIGAALDFSKSNFEDFIYKK